MRLARLNPCVPSNNKLRFSQCINIVTRVIDIATTKKCCQSISGKYLEPEILCKNAINSDYGICCMQATSHNRGLIGIWSNFTMVEGFLAHTNHQLNCAENEIESDFITVKEKHYPNTTDNVSADGVPLTEDYMFCLSICGEQANARDFEDNDNGEYYYRVEFWKGGYGDMIRVNDIEEATRFQFISVKYLDD